MIQVVFFALLIVALFAGFFKFYAPSHPMNPLKFVMDNSGYATLETQNRKESKTINMTMTQGILEVRQKMDDIAIKQNHVQNTINDQEQILGKVSRDANDILIASQNQGLNQNHDVLQLQALVSEMQDSQQLLVSGGQDLISLNNQIAANRRQLADQIDQGQIRSSSSISDLQQNYTKLSTQASDFFDKVSAHNQQVKDQMDQLEAKLNDMVKDKSNGPGNKNIQQLLDKERQNMLKLADLQDKSKMLLSNEQEKISNSNQNLNDAKTRQDDLIYNEHQQQEDENAKIQQHIEDERQRLEDLKQ